MSTQHERIRCHIREYPHELGDIVDIWLSEYLGLCIESIDGKIFNREFERLFSQRITIGNAGERMEISDKYCWVSSFWCLIGWKNCPIKNSRVHGFTCWLYTGNNFFHTSNIYFILSIFLFFPVFSYCLSHYLGKISSILAFSPFSI